MSVDRVVLLCGGPDIWSRGVRLHLASPARRQAVLALSLMLLEGLRPVPADELADAVWPQGPPKSWPASLRRIMSDVRAWLDAGAIHAEVRAAHGTYELVLPPGVSCDVLLGRAALRRAREAGDDAEHVATAVSAAVAPT